MDKIALIIPYFGKWPEYFELYLYSASRNPFIDFIFYTDLPLPEKTYANTIFHYITFEDYCRRSSEILNVDFSPTRPYKLCDLRLFYGIIHEEDLQAYGWWGFGDIDLVYGDLSLLVNEKNMSRYDLLTTGGDRIAGHFTIMRKSSRFTHIGFDVPDWKTLLEKKENVCIDETYFTLLVKPFYLKFFDKIYWHILSYKFSYYHLLFFSWWGRLVKPLFKDILWKESFTTFVPKKGVINTYNLATGEIVTPSKQRTYVHGGVFTCTSFSSSKTFTERASVRGNKGFIKYPRATTLRKVA